MLQKNVHSVTNYGHQQARVQTTELLGTTVETAATGRIMYASDRPLPSKKAWKYNSILTYISVSFFSLLFSFKNFVPVTVKNRVRVTVSSRVRVRVRVRVRIKVQGSGFVFGTGNLNQIR